MIVKCDCHCIRCKNTQLTSKKIDPTQKDGYYDMHHTCESCGAHFDHLDGTIFDTCEKCGA